MKMKIQEELRRKQEAEQRRMAEAKEVMRETHLQHLRADNRVGVQEQIKNHEVNQRSEKATTLEKEM